ncbi:MAG: PDZ domain-containing protein, partial [Hymenobacter sp.]
LTVFRFEQLTGGIVLLKGTLDGIPDSLNFILDTGSGGISLDSTTVKELALPLVHTNRTIRGIAGIRQVDYTMNHLLHLPGLTIDSLNFHINDYSLLTSVHGVRIDGIIGYSVLHRYIVAIDYNKHLLSFYLPGSYKYERGGTLLRPGFNGLPMQAADIKDARKIPHRFYLDTGGGLCLLLSQSFVDDSTLFIAKKKILPTVTEGLGGRKEMSITTVKEIKLGPYKFKKVPAYVFNDEYNVTNYPILGGLIGADLLRRFNVTLNYPQGEIHLLPNEHFKEPFDYSYSGMELVAEEGKTIISLVLKNSPAEQCGLHEGDQIFAIDNTIGASFQNIKTLLQNTANKVKVVVLRNGVPVEVRMKMGRIY